jgi:hypothetical protein
MLPFSGDVLMDKKSVSREWIYLKEKSIPNNMINNGLESTRMFGLVSVKLVEATATTSI